MSSWRFAHTKLVEWSVVAVVVFVVVVALSTADTSRNASGTQATSLIEASPIVTSTMLPGEITDFPALDAADVMVERTNDPPLISQEMAMQAVHDYGIPWGLGGAYSGQMVTVSAIYGIATFGSRADDGQWIGLRNIPVFKTGETLDHLADRPMWIIDYGNVIVFGSEVTFDHAVYAVDAEFSEVMAIWAYGEVARPSDEHEHVDGTAVASP